MTSSQFHMTIPALLAGAMMILILASPMDAMASKCPYPGHPSCPDNGGGGDGSGDFTNTAQDTYAWWGDESNYEIHSEARECFTENLSVNQGYSHDECDISAGSPTVSIGFSTADYVGSGRKPELCDLLSEGVVFGDATNRITGFHFSVSMEWNGTVCLDDVNDTTTCRIRILNTAYGELCTDAELASEDCGDRLIVMTGFGYADAAPAPEVNPFTQEQDIDLNESTFAIKAIGKNRTEATCTVTFPPAAVRFHTIPRFEN